MTNERALLERAGLRGVDDILAGLTPHPGALTAAIDETAATLERTMREV